MGLLDSLFNVAGSFLQQGFNQQNMATQHKYNELSAKNQFKRNKEMWDYTNFENQMKHIKAAGLSPALIYGGNGAGGMGIGGSSGMAQTGLPSSTAPQATGNEMGIMDIARLKNETKVADSQAEKNRAEANEANTRANQNMSQDELNKANKAVAEADEAVKKAEENYKKAQTHLAEEQASTEWFKREELAASAYEKSMIAIKTNIDAQIQEKVLNNWEQSFKTQIASMVAQINLDNKHAELLQKQIDNYWNEFLVGKFDVETRRSSMQVFKQRTEAEIRKWQDESNRAWGEYEWRKFDRIMGAISLGMYRYQNLQDLTTTSTTTYPNGNQKTTVTTRK